MLSRIVVDGSDADELGDLLAVEFSEFGKFGDERADVDGTEAFDRLEDFDFAGVGLVGLDRFGDSLRDRFKLFIQAIEHGLDRLFNIGIDRLQQAIVLLIDQAEELPTTFDECTEFGLLVGLSGLRRGSNDFGETCQNLCVDRIGFGVATDAVGKVADLARINDGQHDVVLMQLFDQPRFVSAGGFHDDDGRRGFRQSFDPGVDCLFGVGDSYHRLGCGGNIERVF